MKIIVHAMLCAALCANVGCDSDPTPVDPPNPGAGPALGPGDDTGVLEVDETGFLVGEHMRYTAPSALSETAIEVSVIGLPGAVTTPGGTLEAANVDSGAAATLTATGDDGALVVRVEAALGDSILLTYSVADAVGELTLSLGDNLVSISAPEARPAGTSGSQPPPELSAQSDGDGTILVNLADLADASRPVAAYNAAAGSAAIAEAGASTVSLAGASGDEVCLFAVAVDVWAASTEECLIAE